MSRFTSEILQRGRQEVLRERKRKPFSLVRKRNPVRIQRQCAAASRPVLAVAAEREAARGELHADLVRSPGIQTNRHRRCSLREPPEGAESQPRFFHTGAAARDDVGFVFPPVVIQQITPLSLLRRRPLADGKIFLFKCPGLHGGGECSSAPRRFCEYHQAAGLAVETMDGPEASAAERIPCGLTQTTSCASSKITSIFPPPFGYYNSAARQKKQGIDKPPAWRYYEGKQERSPCYDA